MKKGILLIITVGLLAILFCACGIGRRGGIDPDPITKETATEEETPALYTDLYTMEDYLPYMLLWHQYEWFGCACEFSPAPESVYDYMTEYQASLFVYVHEVECCNTMEEMKAHLREYFSDELLKAHDYCAEEMFFEHDGRLYLTVIPMGMSGYNVETAQIIATNGNVVTVTMDLMDLEEVVGQGVFEIEAGPDGCKLVGFTLQ